MQLKMKQKIKNNTKFSIIACSVLIASSLNGQDYVSVQYMGYDEDSGRTDIKTPSFELSKDFGADYTLKLSFTHDTVSGASPTFYDASSGASATLPQTASNHGDIFYGDIPYEDKRKAYAGTLTTRFASRDELTVGLNYSDEDDYTSNEISTEYLHHLDANKNQSVSFGLSYQKNDVSTYCFLGNDVCDGVSGASGKVAEEDLKVITGEIGFTQVIDKTSLVKTSFFMIKEDGYLSNPYMRVVRNYNTNPIITEETKPDEREALGMFIQYSKAIDERLKTNFSYRYYDDSWDITSHTLSGEAYYDVTKDFTAGAGIRYYTQSEAKFFSPQRSFFTNEEYASSDRRMSEFDSINYKISGDYKINDDLSLNGAVGYYEQADYFDSTYYNMGFKYKF